MSVPIGIGDALDIGHILSTTRRVLYSYVIPVPSAVGGRTPVKSSGRNKMSDLFNYRIKQPKDTRLTKHIVIIPPCPLAFVGYAFEPIA